MKRKEKLEGQGQPTIRQIKRVRLINSFHDIWDEDKREIRAAGLTHPWAPFGAISDTRFPHQSQVKFIALHFVLTQHSCRVHCIFVCIALHCIAVLRCIALHFVCNAHCALLYCTVCIKSGLGREGLKSASAARVQPVALQPAPPQGRQCSQYHTNMNTIQQQIQIQIQMQMQMQINYKCEFHLKVDKAFNMIQITKLCLYITILMKHNWITGRTECFLTEVNFSWRNKK